MNTGLVLSGGGVRGIAHIGVIKALEEKSIYPSYIAGTSAGAIVGALYASGCGWEQMLEFFNRIQLFGFNKYALNKPGFINTEKFYGILAPYFPEDNFNNLEKSLYITATNLLNGELKIFSKGELIRPILASAAFPGLFTPVKIDNEYYIDGGTLNNFPVDLISMYCDHIIGVYVNPFDILNNGDFKHSYEVLERALKIKSGNECNLKFGACDLLISPKDLNNYSTFYMKNTEEIFNLGYNEAIEILESENGIHLLNANHIIK